MNDVETSLRRLTSIPSPKAKIDRVGPFLLYKNVRGETKLSGKMLRGPNLSRPILL